MTERTAESQGRLENGVVVGHDGSRGADQALSEALGLASALAAPVLVVRAWSIATAPRPDGWEFGYVPFVRRVCGGGPPRPGRRRTSDSRGPP